MLIICALIKPQSAFASGDTSFYKAMASFIYNLQKLIKNREGSLCIYGYDQVSIAIEEKFKSSSIFLKSSKELEVLDKNSCGLLYISKNNDKSLNQVFLIADKYKIVTVGLEDRFIDDGGIVLVQMGRRNFELVLNHKKIKEYAIQFDPIISNLLVE